MGVGERNENGTTTVNVELAQERKIIPRNKVGAEKKKGEKGVERDHRCGLYILV
jgi:hypothetical protein